MERIGGQFDEDCTVISRPSIYFINNKLKWEDTASSHKGLLTVWTSVEGLKI